MSRQPQRVTPTDAGLDQILNTLAETTKAQLPPELVKTLKFNQLNWLAVPAESTEQGWNLTSGEEVVYFGFRKKQEPTDLQKASGTVCITRDTPTIQDIRVAGVACDSQGNPRTVAIQFNPETGNAYRVNVSVSGQELPEPYPREGTIAYQSYLNNTVHVPSLLKYPYYNAGLVTQAMVPKNHKRGIIILDSTGQGDNMTLYTHGYSELLNFSSKMTTTHITLAYNPYSQGNLTPWSINVPRNLQRV